MSRKIIQIIELIGFLVCLGLVVSSNIITGLNITLFALIIANLHLTIEQQIYLRDLYFEIDQDPHITRWDFYLANAIDYNFFKFAIYIVQIILIIALTLMTWK